jgi:CTD small phosphatase-like protein 2
MHPARPVEAVAEETTSWVGRKVDALFSPVLSFLSAGSKDEAEEAATVTDEDVNMEETTPKDETPSPARNADHKRSEEEEGTLSEDPSSEVDEEEEDEFNPYLFIKSLPRYEAVQHLRPPIALPPKDPNAPPITLVLDLDETLVHCTVEPTADADETFPVVFHGMEYLVHVKLRPYVFDFLQSVCEKFEVVVFTASQKVYADELLNRIDPSKYSDLYSCFARLN